MSKDNIDLEFLQQKDEYKREFAIESLANLVYELEDSGVYLESEEFRKTFVKLEMIKDMFINLWKEENEMFKFGKYIFNSFKEFQDVQNLAIASGLETMKEFTEFLSANYSHKLIKSNWGGKYETNRWANWRDLSKFWLFNPKVFNQKSIKKGFKWKIEQ